MAEEKVSSDQNEALMKILNRAIPQDMQEWHEEQLDALREDPNIIPHDDKVAVLDISTSALTNCDGWPGYLDVPRPGEFNSFMLRKKDRYQVVINFVPSMEYVYNFRIVPVKEWQQDMKDKPGGLTPAQQYANMMRRSQE